MASKTSSALSVDFSLYWSKKWKPKYGKWNHTDIKQGGKSVAYEKCMSDCKQKIQRKGSLKSTTLLKHALTWMLISKFTNTLLNKK